VILEGEGKGYGNDDEWKSLQLSHTSWKKGSGMENFVAVSHTAKALPSLISTFPHY
jgi:hypothetical protein